MATTHSRSVPAVRCEALENRQLFAIQPVLFLIAPPHDLIDVDATDLWVAAENDPSAVAADLSFGLAPGANAGEFDPVVQPVNGARVFLLSGVGRENVDLEDALAIPASSFAATGSFRLPSPDDVLLLRTNQGALCKVTFDDIDFPSTPDPSDRLIQFGQGPLQDSPADAFERLLNEIETLTAANQNSLAQKVEAAMKAADAITDGSARQDAEQHLEAFINAVEARRDKQLTGAEADRLITLADVVLTALRG